MKKRYIKRYHLWRALLGLLTLISLVACDDSDIVRRVEPNLNIEETLLVSPSRARQVVKLRSTYPWFAEASDAWIKLYRYRGQALKPDSIVMELEENPEMKQREGWIEIRLMDQMTKRISVKQNGRGSLITLSKELLCFNVNGGETMLDVVTDLDWLVDQGQASGITFEKVDKGHLKIKVSKNTTGQEVKQVVTLTDAKRSTETKLTIIQSNVERMLSIPLTKEEKDKILMKGAHSLVMPISVNVPFECVASDNWVAVGQYPEFTGDIVQDINISLSVKPNDGVEERTASVVVRNKGDRVVVSDTLWITQRAFSRIVYVKKGGTGDGTSWDRAFGRVEDALAVCGDYSDMELWVAAGEYQLKDYTTFRKINIYGGFKGTETKLVDRDLNNKSILIAAPKNPWPSIYGYKIEGTTRYIDGFVFTGSNVKKGEGTMTIYDNWVIRNCIIRNNTAYRDAGGYFANATLINVLICNNTTQTTSSTVNASGTNLYNVTIVNNESGGGCAGLRLGGKDVVVVNTVVWGNKHTRGANHQGYLDSDKNAKFIHCAVQDGYVFNKGFTPLSTEGCITLNADNGAVNGPRFVNPTKSDYLLQGTSPLINAGSNKEIGKLGLTCDILGALRIWDNVVDMGAFEYHPLDK